MELNLDNLQQITSGFYIPPKPEILIDLHQEMAADEPDLSRIAALIAHDVGLSAVVLKTINSPFFGMRRMISDIQQATMLLGSLNVISLVSAYELRRNLSGEASISLERFWDTATEVAGSMVAFGRQVNQMIPPEDLYTIGLFHDCGIPVLAMRFSDYREVLVEGNQGLQTISEIEERRYTTNHGVIGYFISNSWGIPKRIAELILRHHERDFFSQCSDEWLLHAMAMLKACENIITVAKRNHNDPEWSCYQHAAFEILGLSQPDYDDLLADITDLLHL